MISIDFHGFPLISIDVHGCPWIFIGGDIKEYIKKGKIQTKHAIVLARSPLNSLCGMTNFWPLTARALSQGRNKGINKRSHKGRHKGRYKGMKQ